jgi:hypothetical protein
MKIVQEVFLVPFPQAKALRRPLARIVKELILLPIRPLFIPVLIRIVQVQESKEKLVAIRVFLVQEALGLLFHGLLEEHPFLFQFQVVHQE